MATSYEDYLKSLEPKKEDLSYESYKAQLPEKTKPETLESEYLEPLVYPTLEKGMQVASALAKPASMLATPVLESARYGVRALTGQDTSDIDTYSDFKHLQNPKASAGKLMEDIYSGLGIEQGKLGEILPTSLRDQFPKAYAVLSELRPSDIAAIPMDIALYGKFAGPAGAKAVGYGGDQFNRMKLAKNILRAGSTDSALYNDIAASGKLDSLARRIVNDPSLNKVNREDVLKELSGPIIEGVNKYGVTSDFPAGGKLAELNKQQSKFIESLPKNQYTYDAVGANIRAKALLEMEGVLPSKKQSASKLIDEMMPFSQMDKEQLGAIRKKDSLSKQLDEVNMAVEAQRFDELGNLSKINRELLSKKADIPFFVENPNYQKPRTQYTTSTQVEPVPEFTPIKPVQTVLGESGPVVGYEPSGRAISPEPLSKTTKYRQYVPSEGPEQIWNKPGAQQKVGLVKQINDIQNQIETLTSQGFESHPAMADLVSKKNKLASDFWSMQDVGFPTEQAYVEHLQKLNEQPIQVADDIRKMANRYKYGLTKGSEEFTPGELAANAVEKATREAIDVPISQMPEGQSLDYYKRQAELSDLLNLKEMYSGTYSKSDGVSLPIGDPIRGAARAALSSKGRYIDPILLDLANKYRIGEGPVANIMRTVGVPKAAQIVPAAGMMSHAIPTEMQAKAMQRGLVENLADYEIPRSSQEILANPQMALAKLSQVTDNQGLVKGLRDAIEKHPDKLKSILPLMGMQFPNLFVADKYNRFDGKIFNPDPVMRQQMIQRAYKDVELKGDLSNTEKAMLYNGLNRDGSLPETFQ